MWYELNCSRKIFYPLSDLLDSGRDLIFRSCLDKRRFFRFSFRLASVNVTRSLY